MLRQLWNKRQVTGVEVIDPQGLQAELDKGSDVVVVDVRSAGEYAGGHVAGSRLLPLFTLPLRHNELPKDKRIVCVCRSGARSQAACEQLVSLGFTDVINLQGGMMAWERAGLPVSN
ncbi:MAG TPA: rhodanese-like domain-containing protein [Anaerolineae bacterium]|nr:rhodanese-like domain-containing protein [Anaerolineae bacterium]